LIWLLRHGDAEDSPPGGEGGDAARLLTAKGEEQARAAGRALSRVQAKIETCLASPKARALDTARLACTELGIEPEVSEELAGGDFDPERLAAGRGETLLIGHEPDFSRAIGAATGGRVKLKKGGLAALEAGQLIVLLRPAELQEIASKAGSG
jgi:phosphohistidine phosphatase